MSSGSRNRDRRRRLAAARLEADKALEAIYARVPDMKAPGCKGLCWHTCAVIDMADRERERCADAGVIIPAPPKGRMITEIDAKPCPALTEDNRCGVYEVRPLICRVWGVANRLPCPHGCEPEEVLPDAEVMGMIAESMAVGGHPNQQPYTPDEVRELYRQNEAGGFVRDNVARGIAADARRAQLVRDLARQKADRQREGGNT